MQMVMVAVRNGKMILEYGNQKSNVVSCLKAMLQMEFVLLRK